MSFPPDTDLLLETSRSNRRQDVPSDQKIGSKTAGMTAFCMTLRRTASPPTVPTGLLSRRTGNPGASSSELKAGSREENALNQEIEPSFRFYPNGKTLGAVSATVN
jgi:hypothetical protein